MTGVFRARMARCGTGARSAARLDHAVETLEIGPIDQPGLRAEIAPHPGVHLHRPRSLRKALLCEQAQDYFVSTHGLQHPDTRHMSEMATAAP
jgi:hypothetical protein